MFVAFGVIALVVQFRKNLYKEQIEQEKLKEAHHQELLRTGILTQEGERKRIAQNMHDELGAVLSIAKMNLTHIDKKYGGLDEKLHKALRNVIDLADNSIENTRRISHELMPPQLEKFGLIKTFENFLSQLTQTGKINAFYSVDDGMEEALSEEFMKMTVYRICMELINNTLKHAEAQNLFLTFKKEGENVMISYVDNGKGLPKEGMVNGIGINSIIDRVQLINGTLKLYPDRKGFNIDIFLPVK